MYTLSYETAVPASIVHILTSLDVSTTLQPSLSRPSCPQHTGKAVLTADAPWPAHAAQCCTYGRTSECNE